jgi:hypothetical protein
MLVYFAYPVWINTDHCQVYNFQWQGMAKLEFDIQIPNIVEQHNTFILHLS